MRADAMTWVLRAVGAVFVIGVLALSVLVVVQVRSAEGIPPLPVFAGLLGLVLLILLAGACLALISLAISARSGAESLRRLAATGHPAGKAPAPAPKIFSTPPLQEIAKPEPDPVPARPARPAGRNLVAER